MDTLEGALAMRHMKEIAQITVRTHCKPGKMNRQVFLGDVSFAARHPVVLVQYGPVPCK